MDGAKVTGTCAICGLVPALLGGMILGGMIPQHDRANEWTGGQPTRWTPCAGSGKRPVEFTVAARATKDRRLAAQVAAARDYAMVALDAVLSGRSDLDAEIPKLLKLAAIGGRLAWPAKTTARNSVARSTRWWSTPWVAVNRRQIHARSGRTRRGPDIDVYCVFCGEMILSRVDAKGTPTLLRALAKTPHAKRCELNDRVYLHTTPCALQCLAGMREYAAPGTRKLPAGMEQE